MIKRHINSMLECISRTKNSQTYPLLCPISRTWINAYRAWCIMTYLNLFKGSLICRPSVVLPSINVSQLIPNLLTCLLNLIELIYASHANMHCL